jgi:predicted DNA-binding transcriptional regulator AlpA
VLLTTQHAGRKLARMGNAISSTNHERPPESIGAPAFTKYKPQVFVGEPDNQIGVRITSEGAIELTGEMTIPAGATRYVVIDFLPNFENRVRELLRNKPLLTVKDVALKLNVDESFVYRRAKDLGAVSLGDGRGTDIRFSAADIDAWIARRKHKR